MDSKSITVSEFRKTAGFHIVQISKTDADAILRGDKAALIVSADTHVQKGDWLVFAVYESSSYHHSCFHQIADKVFEVTYVSDIQNCDPHSSLVCFKTTPGYTYHPGDISSKFIEDTITYE